MVERKEVLIKSLNNLSLPFEFIDKYDRDNLKEIDLVNFTLKTKTIFINLFFLVISKRTRKSIYENDDMSLILEDDSIPNDVFTENMKIFKTTHT